ncbi:prokaryotic molybdopterin-containing oxidoreductase family, iron-sulfur binding subunit [Candidatus Kryptonium thompsonii]|uniref:4Fe-4S dicluster domain-containing protein n=1 Tax=Candidatus Kryptonium thompsonii TaxID=1633631 RepID=UPI0007083D45|nr:4Fe-4S dicluster domain-containing protein [Candidatus Kryptonium thompsoni]CUS92650.1 prokaryotic molybdopterin-containing oxidoreductase family, iron-sulfur binding subunit [Candidatus Kryptonium thompsoni]
MVGRKITRRDFIKTVGFFISSAIIASGCRRIPVQKIVPYVEKPKEITPGVPLWYASTFFDGLEYCSITVKTIEGRPIKIEGNELSTVTFGGTSPRVQASILGLYDSDRAKEPMISRKRVEWKEIDAEIIEELKKIKENRGKIRILSQTIISPSTKKILSDFADYYPNTELIIYDTCSASAVLEANKKCFGIQAIPDYMFDKANIVVSFGADFLGTWISPVEYAYKYSLARKPEENLARNKILKHIQFESRLSLTGSNADIRVPVKPSDEVKIILGLLNNLLKISSNNGKLGDIIGDKMSSEHNEVLSKIALELWANRSKSIVISDSNDINVQILINAINLILNNYGNTIDLNNPCYLRQGIDSGVYRLIEEMENGEVSALILYHVNPVYSFPEPERFVNALRKVPLTISISNYFDETAEHVKYFCPDHHYLESWNDAEPKKGHYSFSQPVIGNLFNTRQGQESFLLWMNRSADYLTYMQEHWREDILKVKNEEDFKRIWIECLEKGVYEVKTSNKSVRKYRPTYEIIADAVNSLKPKLKSLDGKIELILYQDISVSDGRYANNPWLQELPDPITKVCWDNYVSVSPEFALENNLKQGDVVKLSYGRYAVDLPIFIQPGQAYGTFAVALGYGRWRAGKIGNGVGANAFPFIIYEDGTFRYSATVGRDFADGVRFEKTVKSYKLAQTQLHSELEGRPIIKEMTLEDLKNGKLARDHTGEGLSFYPEHKYPIHHWGMVIDLNACIGCGACVIACQVENNIPVVGREEVLNAREMHWIRIDRYYLGDPKNPKVVFQPMMCQHCDNAPCEAVCPVSATMHSSEGISQQIYNRCIGVRFCLNNCPYKVRRFNWYDYTGADSFSGNEHIIAIMDDEIERMVLNPDVTVRSRGVTEKCTFCIQRIQAGKLKAKMENRKLKDGEIKTACQQACPTKAIVFGDLNDPESEVSKKI